ncbi:MAG: carph-isopro domain-containing protein [Reyranella sp.]
MTPDSAWTWASVIAAAGGTKGVAEGLGESTSTVSGWKVRPGGIPGKHWSALVTLAAEAGRPEITLEVLAEVAARRQVNEEARA